MPDAAADVATLKYGTAQARFMMYVLMCGYILALKTVRAAIPSLMPILGAALGFSEAELAANLSGFFLGYTAFQIPGSLVAQKYGGKGVLTISMAGTAVLFGSLPAVARRWGAAGTAAQMVAAGVIQSFFTPGLAQINRDWLPPGSLWQVWCMRAQTLCGDALVNMTAAVLTPALCVRGGWPHACRVYAALAACSGVVWQLAARARPAAVAAPPVERQETAPPAPRAVEWGIFSLRPVQALTLFWVSAGYASMNLTQLAPLCLTARFGLGPVAAGRCIATALTINVPGNLITGAIESWLLQHAVPVLWIRQTFTRIAACGTAAASLAYGAARTPAHATAAMMLYFASHQFNNSGFFPNFLELGGLDTSLLTSTANTLAAVAVVAVAPIGVLLRRLSGGSWQTQYYVSAALLLCNGLFYAHVLTTEPARDLLEARKRKAATSEPV
jgi:hypothetical protein